MPILYYVHDPMCSWCWGFRKTWTIIKRKLPQNVKLEYLVGGLAPDSDQAMPEELKQQLPKIWQAIESKIPGTKFNFDFWKKCQPRRSTYPACRAVLAAKILDEKKEDAMILGIQEAYYLNAKNPSDLETLVYVAGSIGLNKSAFTQAMSSVEVEAQLHQEINKSRSIGANGFPSLVMQIGEGSNIRYQYIPIDYNDAFISLDSIGALV